MNNITREKLATQAYVVDEVLLEYACRCALKEIWEQRSDNTKKWERIPNFLKWPYVALEHSLYDQICNKLWNLLGSSNECVQRRLVCSAGVNPVRIKVRSPVV
jgi:hypothetical protein